MTSVWKEHKPSSSEIQAFYEQERNNEENHF